MRRPAQLNKRSSLDKVKLKYEAPPGEPKLTRKRKAKK